MNNTLINKIGLQNPAVWKALFLALIVVLAFVAFPTFAQENPLKDISIVPNAETNDLGATMEWLLKILIAAIIVVAVVFGLGDAIFGIFASLSDARRNQEWGKFFMSLFMIVIAIAVVLMVAFFMVEVGTKVFQALWPKAS